MYKRELNIFFAVLFSVGLLVTTVAYLEGKEQISNLWSTITFLSLISIWFTVRD